MSRLRAFTSLLAAFAISASAASASAGEPSGFYLDESGVTRAFQPTYDAWFSADRDRPRYGQMIAEHFAVSGFELAIYWLEPTSNIVDWRFPNFLTKITSLAAPRFDNNMHRTNWILHPSAGGVHYGFTRANDFGIPASLAASFLASAFYEWVLEWLEYPSVNDLIVTPIGGMAIGEFFFQFGRYLNSEGPPRTLKDLVGWGPFGRKAAASTLGFMQNLHGVHDAPSALELPYDNLGLSTAYWHRFRASIGYDVVANDQGGSDNAAVVSLGAEIVAMPGFLRPGTFGTWFWNGNFTSLQLRVASDERRVREIDIRVDADLFGHFEQSFEVAPGGLRGTALEIAARTSLQYIDRWLINRRDHYGVLHILGPAGVFWYANGPWRVRLAGDVSPDFAAPRSLAYEPWKARFGEEGTKSSLRMHGYYHSWGVSAGASAAVSYRGLTFAVQNRYGHYESIDGIEIASQPVTREVHCNDDILDLAGKLTYAPPETPFSIGISTAHAARISRMAPISAARSDQRVGVDVSVYF